MAEPKITLFDFLKEIPESTGKVIKGIGSFAKLVQEDITRNVTSAGLTFISPFTKVDKVGKQDVPEYAQKYYELVYGKDPVKNMQTRIAEAEIALPKGEALPFGIKAPKELAFPGIFLMTALDFTGYGGGKTAAIKQLTKLKKVDQVVDVMKQVNVADDLIKTYAPIVAKTNKADDIVKIMDNISNIQKTTKGAAQVPTKPFVPKAVGPITDALKTRKFITSVSKARPAIPLKVGGQYIPRSTDELSIAALDLIKTNIDEAKRIARTGTDDTAVATASELIKHYADEAALSTNKAVKDALYEQAADLTQLTAMNLTEQGRSIQAASIIGRQTPEGLLRFATKEINRYNEGAGGFRKKIPNLTPEQTGNILTEFKKIEKMEDGVKKAMAFKVLNNAVADIVPTSLYKKFINVWKAGLLTGVKTSGLNTFSNLFHGASEIIKDIPGAVVDSVLSLFTGKRTLGLTVKGKGGIKEGFEKGWRYLTTGFDERNIGAKLDYKKINFGKGKVAKGIQKYEETIFQLMGAEDQPFYYGAKARSLYSQAIAKSKNAGMKGADARKFVDDLVQAPTDEMLKTATRDAEIAVFQNPTTLGKIAKAIQAVPLGEVVVPFGRTPSSVAMQFLNYTPVGIVKESILAIVKKVKTGVFDQRAFSQAMGRGLTGSGALYIGTQLYKNDLISTSYPTTERERNLWEAEGRKPNTIKFGGKWRSAAVLGPVGFVLIAGASYQKQLEATGSPAEAIAAAGFGGAKSLTEQTFLQGIKKISDAINDPERYSGGYAGDLFSSLVPTLIGDVAKATDTLERRPEGFFGKTMAKIPGLRGMLEPKISITGEEVPRAGNWLETMIDPSRPSNIIAGPVAEELRRLNDAGFSATPTKLGEKEGYDSLTPEENTELWQNAGMIINSKLTNLFASQQYKELDDEQKAAKIEKFVDKIKIIARAEMVLTLTEDLSGQSLRNKLSELKADGLMTKEVYKKALELK